MINRLQTGNFLAQLRRERGLTQAELAEKLAVSGKTVSRWETGQTLPDYDQMQHLCELFQVRMEEILAAKRIEPTAGQTDATVRKDAAPQRSANPTQRAGWIVGICGIVTSCMLAVLLLLSHLKGSDSAPQTQNSAEPATASTAADPAEASAPPASRTDADAALYTPVQTVRTDRRTRTAADLPAELSERQLSDNDLLLLLNASPAVLKERISTVADMLAWFDVSNANIWDSNVTQERRTNLRYYRTPEELLKYRSFATDSLALPCAWMIQDDYEGLCVLYVNGVNCMNNMCIAIPYSGGWFVFDPAAFTWHGSFNGALDSMTVQSLSELYPILDAFNVTHSEYLMPISRIDNLEQEVAFYEDDSDKHLSEETEAIEIPR